MWGYKWGLYKSFRKTSVKKNQKSNQNGLPWVQIAVKSAKNRRIFVLNSLHINIFLFVFVFVFLKILAFENSRRISRVVLGSIFSRPISKPKGAPRSHDPPNIRPPIWNHRFFIFTKAVWYKNLDFLDCCIFTIFENFNSHALAMDSWIRFSSSSFI